MTDLNYNRTLPPSKNAGPKLGYLTMAIEGLSFFNNNKQNCIVKLQFWGSTHPIYIPLLSTETFTIVASLVKFKHYLIDSKATQFQIVDSRNYKPVAIAYLNWLTYLRPIEDKQIYVDKQESGSRERSNAKTFFLPFFDEAVKVTLPIYHYTAQNNMKKEEKIGELMLSWQCRIYEADMESITASRIHSGLNLYNIRVSEVSNRKIQNPTYSICNIDLPEDQYQYQEAKTNKSILSKPPANNSKLYSVENPRPRKSNISILENLGNLRRVREEPEIADQTKTIERMKCGDDLELELIRMRLEMEDLVGAGKKSQAIALEIVHFEPVGKSIVCKDVTFIDIKCEGKEEKGKNSHWRIFPDGLQQEKIFFHSALAIKPASLLTFVVGSKKGKDVLKGNLSIDCIRESYDVNVLSAQGTVVGYIRVKVERKTEISLALQLPQQEKSFQKKESSKPEPLPVPIIKTPKYVDVNKSFGNNHPQQSKETKEPQVESYFLFAVQQLNQSKTYNFSYKIFEMNIAQFNPQKILFLSQREVINKPFVLSIYQNSACVYQEILIKQLRQTPFASVNLTCSLIHEKRISQFEVNCQLYAGNLMQINYFLQNMQQFQRREATNDLQIERHLPTKTEESNKNSVIAQFQDLPHNQQKRKMKTEALGVEDRDRRLTEQKVSGESLAMQKFQMHSQNQVNEQENVYLVDLLTRFLDSMPENLLPEVSEMPKERFLQLIGSKSTIFQVELIDIIISIFQEINSDNINVMQLLQCYKAYKSFFSIYGQQRQSIIKQILQGQPKAAQRIRNNSQFGTLNDSMLWGRALSRIKDPALKQKINKFYKVSAFGTTDSAFLLEDLELKEKELRSLDISNLGMIIKQWVEEFINQAQFENILNLKQKLLILGEQENYLNIRSVGETIEAVLELRLSLWESLMLIEEIKGCYGCDLQLEEGVISGGSILNWIDGVRKRLKLKTENSRVSSSQASLDPEELALIKQININNNNDSQLAKKRQSNHISESKSMIAANNDSDIADIANLLRDRDGFMPMELIEQTKTNNIKENRLIESNVIVQGSPEQLGQSSNFQVIQNRKKKEDKESQKIQKLIQQVQSQKEKEANKTMQFFIEIRQLKIYNEKSQPSLIKAIFLLQGSYPLTQEHFYYLTSKSGFTEANKQVIRYMIDRKSMKNQEKGIKYILKDQDGKNLFNGFLPIEEINDWFGKNQAECKRTIVLYEANGKIGGKFVINLLLAHSNYNKQSHDNTIQQVASKINLTLEDMIPTLREVRLFAQINENDKEQITIGKDMQLALDKPVYHCQLVISDQEGSLNAIISLQELYLKGYINQSYPLIDSNAGNFVATLKLTLRYNSKNINEMLQAFQLKEDSKLDPKLSKESQTQTTVCLITQIGALAQKNSYSFTPKLHCLIYRRQATETRQKLALVTPQFTLNASELPSKHFLKNQKIQLQNEDTHSFLQFKLVQNGKVLGYSQKIALNLINSSLHSNLILLSTVGETKVLFTVMLKKCELPIQKYALRRIVQCIGELPISFQKSKLPNLLKQAKISQNLTITQQNMLKEICLNNLDSQQRNYLISSSQTTEISFRFLCEYPEQTAKQLMLALINEFVFFDVQRNGKFTGLLEKKQILQIISSLSSSIHQQVMEQLSDIIRRPSQKGATQQVSYLWIIMLLQGSSQSQSLQIEQKKSLISQIDGIYNSLKSRYG